MAPPLDPAGSTAEPFDFSLAASLYPKLLQLSALSALSQPTQEDPDGRAGKVEVGKQATELRAAFNSLRAQAQALPAGDRSLDDQAWLIQKLEEELEGKRNELARLAELVSVEKAKDAMETD